MADLNIAMKQLNEAGTYDNLFPKTKGSLVDGSVANATLSDNSTKLNGYTYPQVIQNAVNEAIAKGVKIETGSYVGTGTYGASHPNSLTFSSSPSLIFISSARQYQNTSSRVYVPDLCYFVRSGPTALTINTINTGNANVSGSVLYITWEHNGISFYNSNSYGAAIEGQNQLNGKNTTYYYISIGQV